MGAHDVAVLAALVERHPVDLLVPKQRAARHVQAGVVQVLPEAGEHNAAIRASLAGSYSERAIVSAQRAVGWKLLRAMTESPPAFLAARHGHAGVIKTLADTKDPVVLASMAAPLAVGRFRAALHTMGLAKAHGLVGSTPAHVAARYGHAAVVRTLADTKDPAILATLPAPRQRDGFTAEQLAAQGGYAGVVEAMARSTDPEIRASLAAPHPTDGWTPAQRAAESGRVAFIHELEFAGDLAILESLAARDPRDGLTPEDRARKNGHETTANALRDAVAVPADERALKEKACVDLEDQTQNTVATNLAIDLRCSVSWEPFGTIASSRPIHLTLADGTLSRQCVSARWAHRVLASNRRDPLTGQFILGVQEAPNRVALVREVVDAYRRHPDNPDAARATALRANLVYEERESAGTIARTEATQWAAIFQQAGNARPARRGGAAAAVGAAL